MQQPPSTENPVRWTTRLVLDWMRKYDDSREEVKKKILDVIERNDIDGLTLKQLRADSEEIHTLFPSLKERLTFKAMLRDIFKDVKCCNNNGCNNNSFCNQDAMNHAKSPTQQQPPSAVQLSPKYQNAHVQANHKHGSSYPRSEDANQKSSGQPKRSSPHLLSRPVLLPRQESKENNQVIHVDTSPPTSRAKISPIAVSMVANTQSTLPARERDLTSAQMQRFISPQGLHTNQLLTHTSPPATATMYPFPPIAGQFNVSVANQALAAALAARGLSHQQPYQQSQSQSPATVGSPVGGGSRPSPYVPQSHPRSLGSTSSAASAVTTAAASAPSTASAAAAQQVVEIVDKDDPESPSTSTSAADQNSHSASSPVPVALPLVSTRGRPATKGAIRSAKISQKYRKIIQRMKSAHKQVIEIPYPAPLPGFSQLLRQQIGRGNIANFRSRFTYECAQYYMSLNPTPSHTEYRNISKTVVENFPVLSSPDEDVPWRKFNNHLSQAIRNIRRQLRSVPNSGYPPAQKRKYWRNLASQVMCGSALSLTHLTPQQQQQQMSQVMHGSGSSTDHCFDEDESSLDDKEVIVLKEDKDEDDEEDVDDETEGFKGDDNELEEREDEDDGIIPAEWVNKRK
ncbi:uncharacterized protein [Diadema antillarum]|uniref:uncharacterized protein n=1 Tax=Diadema antillarum TaxID=105358 RepID=UPI003A8B4F62